MTLPFASYNIPASVDLRPGMDNVPNVRDQVGNGSCIAHTTATMYETVMDRNTGAAGRDFQPSRLYLYYWLLGFMSCLIIRIRITLPVMAFKKSMEGGTRNGFDR